MMSELEQRPTPITACYKARTGVKGLSNKNHITPALYVNKGKKCLVSRDKQQVQNISFSSK